MLKKRVRVMAHPLFSILIENEFGFVYKILISKLCIMYIEQCLK